VFSVTKALCPIDFSPSSDTSLEAALGIARAYGADLYLLHVLEGPALPEGGAIDASRAETAREEVRSRLASLTGASAEGITLHFLVSDGDAAEEILRMEEIFGIDLIVLAPHGRPTLGKIIFGSVAEKVTRGAKASILIVKQHFAEGGGPFAE
jgi:nucleotide-binding universal stress UspA family protein